MTVSRRRLAHHLRHAHLLARFQTGIGLHALGVDPHLPERSSFCR
jgi:hypothetical protein